MVCASPRKAEGSRREAVARMRLTADRQQLTDALVTLNHKRRFGMSISEEPKPTQDAKFDIMRREFS